MDDRETVEMLERLGGDVLSPPPAVAGLVTRGRTGRRRRARVRAASALAAAVVLVAGVVAFVPHGDSHASVAAPAGMHVVTDPAAVVGDWLVVAVDGGPPPAGAQRELDLSVAVAGLDASYESGVNSYDVTWSIGSDGRLTIPEMFQTEARCGDPCGEPGGFGVDAAAALGLTDDGDLVLIGDDGHELAVYERAAPPLDGPPPHGRLVTDPKDVLGLWSVVSVRGHAPPAHAIRGIDISRYDRKHRRLLLFAYSYGSGSINVTTLMSPTGDLIGGMSTNIGVGCNSSCVRPSGFGVGQATQLRLTKNGRLILVGANGRELAVYERTS